jgi:hypothetical protein
MNHNDPVYDYLIKTYDSFRFVKVYNWPYKLLRSLGLLVTSSITSLGSLSLLLSPLVISTSTSFDRGFG